MSDGMEREKNERLTVQKDEEKKMRQQLMDIGLYEAQTYEQMKDLIGFLNNCDTTPNVAADNRHTKDSKQHSNNECLSGLMSDTNAPQAVVAQELPNVTYKPSRTSPTIAQQERKSSRHSSSSLDTSSIFDGQRYSAQGRKGVENDETMLSSERQQHEQPSKPRNGAQERRNSSAEKTMQCATQSTHYQQLERWRMNPLDVCINENDVPLQQPRRSTSGCRINKTHMSEQDEQKMRQHLREMADLWYSWQRPANAKFEWGVPIEVGTANGSLDRKPVTESKTEPSKAECTYRDSYERSSKRKANFRIAQEFARLNKESSSEEEDDQYEFARIKKKRIQPDDDKSSNAADRANQQRIGRHEAAVARQQHSRNDGNGNAHIDDENGRSPRRGKVEDEENERQSPVLSVHPKRAIPSTPRARPGLSRIRRGNATSKLQHTLKNEERDQKKDVLMDEDIRLQLDGGEEVAAILRKDTETRPSKEAKSQEKQQRLLSSTALREACKEREKQGGNKKADPQRKNEDKIRGIENKGMSWERSLLDDDEIDQELAAAQNGNQPDKVTDSTNNINCPICNKPFPPNEIENHAADCNQFETNDLEDIDDIELLKCNICHNYTTTNGVEYELHVRQCIDIRKDKRLLHGSDDVDIVPIPSSHRTYKPSGQKVASSSPEIDFMDQSPSHSRTRVFTNRKRKH